MSEAKTFTDVGIDIPHGRSGEIDVLCPECSPTRKKFNVRDLSVNTDKGTWHCAHCGWSGGLNGAKDEPAPYGAPLAKPTYKAPPPPPTDPLPPQVRAWFEKRGIPDWVTESRKVAAGPHFMTALDAEVMTIQYPYWRDGKHVNTKYRAHPKHFQMVKGAERILYGLNDIADADEFCVTEGEMDVLAIDTANGPPAVSVPDGAPPVNASNYAAKFSFLDSARPHFERAKVVILATDMDEPGQKLANELARRIGPEKCRRVVWPDGCKDANETLVKFGAGAVCTAIADAQPYPVAGVTMVRDLIGELDLLYETGFDRGVVSGWFRFDTHYRARVGLLTIITGSPGSGKSLFIDNLMVRLAETHDWAFGVCSPENQPLKRHLAGILQLRIGKPFMDGPTPRMTPDERVSQYRWLGDHFGFVLPEEPTIDAILEGAKVLVYRLGIRGLVVDPWNEIDHARPDRMTETEYVSQVLSRIRQFARTHDLHVWLVAHPTKLQRDKDGTYPVPTPYDISGSANFFSKADACLSVWRDKTDATKPVSVHVQKIRFAETGELGVVDFWYDKATTRFIEAGP